MVSLKKQIEKPHLYNENMEAVELVVHSCAAVVSIYGNWITDGETRSEKKGRWPSIHFTVFIIATEVVMSPKSVGTVGCNVWLNTITTIPLFNWLQILMKDKAEMF